MKSLFAAGLVSLAFGSSVSAATITQDAYLDLTGFVGQYAPSLSTTIDGIGVTITGQTYADVTLGNDATITQTAPFIGVGINNNGLGVCPPNKPGNNCQGGAASGDQIGGGSSSSTTDNQMLAFDFTQSVTIIGVTWHNNDTNDFVDFFVGDDWTLTAQQFAIAPPNRTDAVNFGPLMTFGIGLQDHSDQLRVAGLRVQYDVVAPVPVPAAGLMLLTALGGAAALRRRKT